MNKNANMTVYMTDEYDRFKFTKWNRVVNPVAVEKIASSMAKYGYLGSPIAVNEFNEVIDGQHRLKACELTKTPVLFVVYKGYGFNEAMELNNKQKSWNNLDYAKAYAEMGNVNYVKLMMLIERFKEPFNVIWMSMGLNEFHSNVLLKEGRLVISDKNVEDAISNLNYIKRLKEYRYKFVGRLDYAFKAICRLLEYNLFDKEVMLKKLASTDLVVNCSDIDTVVETLENIYNKSSRNKVYFYNNWRIMRDKGDE